MIRAPKTWLVSFFDEAPFRQSGQHDSQQERLLKVLPWRRGLVFGAPILDESQVIASQAEHLAPVIRLLTVLSEYIDVESRHNGNEAACSTQEDALQMKKLVLVRALAIMLNQLNHLEALQSDDDVTQDGLNTILIDLGKECLSRRYLFGNPLVGLTLSYPCVRIDAHVLMRLVPHCFKKNPPDDLVERLMRDAESERIITIGCIAALSSIREDVSALEKSAAIWQVRNLGFSREVANRLVQEVSVPPIIDELAVDFADDMKERVFINVLISGVIDGRLSNQEQEFMDSLGEVLRVPVLYQKRLKRRYLQFVQQNRRHLNPLEHAVAFEEWGAPLQVRLARRVRKHLEALTKEIRETGNLAVLLGKKARGLSLSETEDQQMREQLLDVVRVVPGLAVFSLPGGAIILPILMKLLPFDLRPSSFRDEAFQMFEESGKFKVAKDVDPQ